MPFPNPTNATTKETLYSLSEIARPYYRYYGKNRQKNFFSALVVWCVEGLLLGSAKMATFLIGAAAVAGGALVLRVGVKG
jgi:hypothetical protein